MGIGKDSWQLFSEEGEMKMYRREEEVNGLVIDPLKACHYVKGFSAHEMCYYFFQPEYRYEWESTYHPIFFLDIYQLFGRYKYYDVK